MPVLQESWPSNGDLRLTGNGSTEDAGRLEIYLEPDSDYGDIEGQWGTVCGRKFRDKGGTCCMPTAWLCLCVLLELFNLDRVSVISWLLYN